MESISVNFVLIRFVKLCERRSRGTSCVWIGTEQYIGRRPPRTSGKSPFMTYIINHSRTSQSGKLFDIKRRQRYVSYGTVPRSFADDAVEHPGTMYCSSIDQTNTAPDVWPTRMKIRLWSVNENRPIYYGTMLPIRKAFRPLRVA